jgi:hypothetical protein
MSDIVSVLQNILWALWVPISIVLSMLSSFWSALSWIPVFGPIIKSIVFIWLTWVIYKISPESLKTVIKRFWLWVLPFLPAPVARFVGAIIWIATLPDKINRRKERATGWLRGKLGRKDQEPAPPVGERIRRRATRSVGRSVFFMLLGAAIVRVYDYWPQVRAFLATIGLWS